MIIRDGIVALGKDKKLRKISIVVREGVITELIENPPISEHEIDAKGLYVLPGGIDAHVHFNTPGYEEREDFYHGSSFAASGGITTVIDMPCTSIPPVTSLKNLKTKLSIIKKQAVTDYAFYGGVSGSDFAGYRERMEELAPYVVGFKSYLISGMSSYGSITYQQLKKLLEAGRAVRRPLLLHTEENNYIKQAEKRERQSGDKAINYYRTRPETAEITAVQKAARLSDQTGGDLHIVHISTVRGAEIAVKHGATVETCPHYLAFDLSDFIRRGSVLKVAPVLKQDERGRLWEKLRDGTITIAASDHAASRREDKETGSIWTDYAGITGSGMLLPYLLSEGYFKKRIGMEKLLDLICENPSRRYGLEDRKGKIEVGMDADLVLINPEKIYQVKGERFLSKGKMTPFEGCEFRGEIQKTFLRGEIVYEVNSGIRVKAGNGRYLRRRK